MIHIEPKVVKERQITDTEKGVRKTLILAEVNNGYIFIKRSEKLNEEGYVEDPSNCEENVFVYYENPLEKEDEGFGDKISEIADKIK
jgi:hypothetical protein